MLKTLILCGGFGSRLGNITKKTPKPLVKINNLSFLEILINFLKSKGIREIYLSTFYKSDQFKSIKNCKIIQEPKKLGSGGAIIFSIKKIRAKDILVVNGDTLAYFNLNKFINSHKKSKKTFSVLTTKKNSMNRYGGFLKTNNNIIFGKSNKIMNVDTGAYIVNKKKFQKTFSKTIECEVGKIIKDTLNKKIINIYNQKNLKFIDIGIPEDLNKIKKKLKRD